jgi:23S rRNA (uracil1939-C5)-methyltransferase
VGDALRRIGRLDLPDPPLVAAPLAWGYRTRVMLSLDEAGRAGFHPLGQPEASFELERCPVASEGLNRLWTALRERRDQWPPDSRQLGLRQDRGGELHAIFRSATRPEARLVRDLRATGGVSCWWEPEDGNLRLADPAGDGGPDFPPAAFEQVNPEMGDRVRSHAIAELGPLAGRHVWDLYAGIGEATILLAGAGATVESVELAPGAVALAERRGPATGIRRRVGRVEDWLGRLEKPSLVLCNPPRGGLGGVVTGGLLATGPDRVVYVSCDPATLARDLAELGAGGYRPASVAAFDLFPQTAHVETVVRLERG